MKKEDRSKMQRKQDKELEKAFCQFKERFPQAMKKTTEEEVAIFSRVRRTHVESQKARFDFSKPVKDLI